MMRIQRIKKVVSLALLIGIWISLLLPAGSDQAGAQQLEPILATQPGTQLPNPRVTPYVRVLMASTAGVELEMRVPAAQLQRVPVEDSIFTAVTLPGFAAIDTPGQPALPQHSVLLGLPPTGDPLITVLQADWQALTGSIQPAPAPTHVATRQADGTLAAVDGSASVLAPEARVYDPAGVAWPEQVAVIGESAWLRDLRVAPLWLRPVRWNPATGQVEIATTLRVRVDFRHDAFSAETAAFPDDPWFDEIFHSAVLNYATAAAWRQSIAARQDQADSRRWAPTPGQPWLKIGVTVDGLYAITPADLTAAGLDLATIDPRYLQLWDDGRQVALVYLGNAADGAFDGGDKLVWFGQRSLTRYTSENVYWLTVGATVGLRAGQVNAQPTQAAVVPHYNDIVHFEENKVYVQDTPHAELPDRWYGPKLTPGIDRSFQIPASALVAGMQSQLTLRLLGISYDSDIDPDHHVRVLLSGQPIADLYWDGNVIVTRTLTLPADAVFAGNNAIKLQASGDTGATTDVSHLDWAELRYARRFVLPATELIWTDETSGPHTYRVTGLTQAEAIAWDVTDPWAPQVLTGAQVQVDGAGWLLRFSRSGVDLHRHVVATLGQLRRPSRIERDTVSDWSVAQSGADYLVISHSSLMDAVQPLVAWRHTQGMRTAVIDVQEIYDTFGDGQMDPAAIKTFLADAYANWPRPAPAFVLLVGYGHYDFQNFLQSANPRPVFIPPLLGCWDPWLCEVPSDNRYVTVSGDDILPDMAIGRLPVQNADQATVVVNKILGYEQALPTGAWRQRVLFVSDNTHDNTGKADPAGNFETLSEQVIAMLPSGYSPVRVYYDPYPTDDAAEAFRYRTPVATTNAILDAINQGQFLVNYVGHAGTPVWAHEWLLVAPSRDRNDVALMTNGPLLPVGLSMGCLSGNFADPVYRSLDAEMMLASAGGTVASWGATGFGVATGHDLLHQGFYDALFRQGVTRLGLITAISKVDLYTGSLSHRDLIDTFILLGDPATHLPFGSDLALSHEPPAGPLEPGDRVDYTVRITNHGDVAHRSGGELALTLPPLEDVAVAWSGLAATPIEGHVRWALGDLAPGAGGTLTVAGILAPDIAAAAVPLRFQAQLHGVWTDRNLVDNATSAVDVPAKPADLAVTWASADTLATPNSPVSATVNYRNLGAAPTGGGHIVLQIPPELRDIQITGPAVVARVANTTQMTVTIPSQQPGANGTFFLTGVVSANASGGALALTARGYAHWVDVDEDNDAATLTLTLIAPDSYEPDDTRAQATTLVVPGRSPGHTIHRNDDRDWFQFTAQPGRIYRIRVQNLSPGGDSVLSLYDAAGRLLAKNDNYVPDVLWSGLDWEATSIGAVYLMVTGWSADPRGFGYDISVNTDHLLFLPVLQRAAR